MTTSATAPSATTWTEEGMAVTVSRMVRVAWVAGFVGVAGVLGVARVLGVLALPAATSVVPLVRMTRAVMAVRIMKWGLRRAAGREVGILGQFLRGSAGG